MTKEQRAAVIAAIQSAERTIRVLQEQNIVRKAALNGTLRRQG